MKSEVLRIEFMIPLMVEKETGREGHDERRADRQVYILPKVGVAHVTDQTPCVGAVIWSSDSSSTLSVRSTVRQGWYFPIYG
jgi:hypothetical protein